MLSVIFLKDLLNMLTLQIMGRPWYTRARLVPGKTAIWSGVGHLEFAHLDSHTIQIAWASSEMG